MRLQRTQQARAMQRHSANRGDSSDRPGNLQPRKGGPQMRGDGSFCGHLMKKGGVRKNWLRRWFVLDFESGKLSYFEPNDGAHGRSGGAAGRARGAGLGVIDILSATSVRKSTAPKADTNEIEVETPDRTYRLKTEKAAERDVWIDKIMTIMSPPPSESSPPNEDDHHHITAESCPPPPE